MMSTDRAAPPPHVAFQVFLDGNIAAVRSVFFYVLIGNYVGLGALAHEVGFSFWWMVMSTLLVWAAPGSTVPSP
ncbi:MAG: branched-chain amino acid ABC transporter permease, partial [Hyphomicrobiales bacterium]